MSVLQLWLSLGEEERQCTLPAALYRQAWLSSHTPHHLANTAPSKTCQALETSVGLPPSYPRLSVLLISQDIVCVCVPLTASSPSLSLSKSRSSLWSCPDAVLLMVRLQGETESSKSVKRLGFSPGFSRLSSPIYCTPRTTGKKSDLKTL